MSSYREIFRKEDGNDRVLFSFQNDGTILSLGLNINGYVECDAKITPERVRDGRWHHCAATFDGRWMRVYLDGDEIGNLERPGAIRAGGSAPGCIGSSNGGECFQGTLDDLRIYAGPLSAVQVAQLYRQGLELIEQSSDELVRHIRAVYQRGDSFAATLMQCRQRIVEQRLALDLELAAAVAIRLKTDFPADYGRFVEATNVNLNEFLAAGEPDGHVKQARRLVDLLLEYKPLTEQQWQRQTPEDRRRWEAAEQVRVKLEQLQAQASPFSPDWIAFLMEVAPQIQARPERSERVAPYVTPETPVTKDLSADEARATTERDWLFQADGQPTAERIRQEIAWTRQLAARLEANSHGAVRLAEPLAELDGLEKQAAALTAPSPELYFRVRQLKRGIMLSNPAVDFQKILLVDMPYPQGNEWPHETRHRLGYMAVPGGRLLILDGLSPAGKLTQLMPQAPLHGSFWRPDVSFDAQKVVFCFKPHNEKAFHLYEINVDGSGLVQLTDGIYDDFDPIYLQDDQHILFSTTRGHTYVRCMPPTNAFVLARCDRDGKNVYLISANNEPDYLPSLMNDGRVIYTRWEYTDKPLWRAQKLWTINPDGTQVLHYWGNQSVWPDLMKDARSIPGSRRVMFTGSAHHNWFSGSVGIIDPDAGYNFPDGITKITADVAWPEVGNGPVDPIECSDYHRSGNYPAYYSPYPLGEQDFLVSAQRNGKFLLYLMDVYGNRELIYEGVNNIFHAAAAEAASEAAADQRPRRLARPRAAADAPGRRDLQRQRVPGDARGTAGQGQAPARATHRPQDVHLLVQAALHLDRPGRLDRPVRRGQAGAGDRADRGRRLGGLPRPPGMALHFQLLDEQLSRAADDAEFRRADAGRAARLPGLPRGPQPHAAGRSQEPGGDERAAGDHAAAVGRRTRSATRATSSRCSNSTAASAIWATARTSRISTSRRGRGSWTSPSRIT